MHAAEACEYMRGAVEDPAAARVDISLYEAAIYRVGIHDSGVAAGYAHAADAGAAMVHVTHPAGDWAPGDVVHVAQWHGHADVGVETATAC